MDQEVKTFENEGYSVVAKQESGCRILLKINVKPNPAQKAYQKAVKTVNKQISIPGFRKGHAPDRTVISRYSSYVEQEWKEILVNEAYRAAIDLIKIYPMNKESIQKPKIEKCSLEEGAVVQIAYEHYPQIPVIDFSQIKIPHIEKEPIEEKKIAEILEEIQRSHADWEAIEGREVQEGDYVDISIDSIQEDPPKSIVKDRRFEVSGKRLPSWLKKLLLGLHINETIEGESELDEEAEASVKENFQATKVRITLHAIKKIVLPELTDELAKKTGAETLEDLRNKISQNLDREAEEEKERRRFKALEEALLEKYPFEVPASLVESERKDRLEERLQTLKNEELSDEERRARQGEIEKQLSFEVDHDVRLYFLNKQIAKQGNISLSNQELNDEIVRYISQNPYLYGKDRDDAATRDLVSRMANAMMQRKTKEYALAQVVEAA